MNYIDYLRERIKYLKEHPEDDKGDIKKDINGKTVKCTELEAKEDELWFLSR